MTNITAPLNENTLSYEQKKTLKFYRNNIDGSQPIGFNMFTDVVFTHKITGEVMTINSHGRIY